MATVAGDSAAYVHRRAWIADYFDRTAAAAWAQLTSDAPVSRVRQSVRAARDRMRGTLSAWLPHDLTGARILDAGCGTGALAVELAGRGADVVAIDLSPTLVALARERAPAELRARIHFLDGDMLDPALGTFDHIVAMDSLIHYRAPEMLAVLDSLRERARESILFTVVPRTPLLTALHTLGRAFPNASRAPAIEPVSDSVLRSGVQPFSSDGWRLARTEQVSGGFYTSQACELLRSEVAA